MPPYSLCLTVRHTNLTSRLAITKSACIKTYPKKILPAACTSPLITGSSKLGYKRSFPACSGYRAEAPAITSPVMAGSLKPNRRSPDSCRGFIWRSRRNTLFLITRRARCVLMSVRKPTIPLIVAQISCILDTILNTASTIVDGSMSARHRILPREETRNATISAMRLAVEMSARFALSAYPMR